MWRTITCKTNLKRNSTLNVKPFCLFNERFRRKYVNLKLSSYFLFILLNSLFICVQSKARLLNNNFTNNIDNFSYNLENDHKNNTFVPKLELMENQSDFYCKCPPKGLYSKCSFSYNQKQDCIISLNTTVSYLCKSGYVKENGSDKLKCILNGNKTEWDYQPLNCKIITCADPGEVENAHKEIHLNKDSNSQELTYKTKIVYNCNIGYKADNLPSLFCDRNGKWNRNKPECKLIQCPHVNTDSKLFSRYTNSERIINTTVNFHCINGYHIDNMENSFRVCQWDGTWSGNNPKCLPNYCELPDDLGSNVQIIPRKDKYYTGETFQYMCSYRKDKILVECLQDGSFSHLPNKCILPKKTHCSPIEIQHGQVNCSAHEQFIIGSKLTFKCDENYILSEDKSIYCQHNGEWTNKPPRCIDIANIENSQMLTLILTCTFVILILVIIITIIIVLRWRQKQIQRKNWQRYFYNYEYHNDKNYMRANSNQEMKLFFQKKLSVPFTDL